MRSRTVPVLLPAAIVLLVLTVIALTGALDGLERRSQDLRFAVRGEQPVADIAVVGIDEDSFRELGNVTWPIRRNLHARAIDALRKAGVSQIVYDVQFTEPSQRLSDDMALFRAVGRAPGTILATGEIGPKGETDVLGGPANLRRVRAIAAAANFATTDHRSYHRAVAGLATIATATAAQVGEAPSHFDDGAALVDFRGPPGTIPHYSFSDLVEGRVPAGALRGRIVVVGATAVNLHDRHQTPMGGGLMSGPEIQANAILTALADNPLRELPGWVALAGVLFCGMAGTLLVVALGPVRGALGGLLLVALYADGAQLAFHSGVVVPLAQPLLSVAACTLAAVLATGAHEFTLRRRMAWRNRELERAVHERTVALERSQLEIVERLARASELRDDETGHHVDRMSQMCERVALELGMPAAQAEMIRRAAVLHDVGKFALPDSILRKPGRLTTEEIVEMREHASLGGELLAGSPSPILQLAETIARTHHERWDGSGYPLGLDRDAIPLPGRIAAVCDVFDALVSNRPYKDAWPLEKAVAEIANQSGSHFDPEVAAALLAVVDRQSRGPDWVASIKDKPEGGTEVPAGRDAAQPLPRA